MTNPVNLVEIGGIKFNRDEVKNVNVKRDQSFSGDLYSVETKNGTFTYRDFPNSIISGGKKIERTILGSTVTNCSLETIIGTAKQDKFYVNNSAVNMLDIAGDDGSRDRVALNKSYVQNVIKDNDDQIDRFNINMTW